MSKKVMKESFLILFMFLVLFGGLSYVLIMQTNGEIKRINIILSAVILIIYIIFTIVLFIRIVDNKKRISIHKGVTIVCIGAHALLGVGISNPFNAFIGSFFALVCIVVTFYVGRLYCKKKHEKYNKLSKEALEKRNKQNRVLISIGVAVAVFGDRIDEMIKRYFGLLFYENYIMCFFIAYGFILMIWGAWVITANEK